LSFFFNIKIIIRTALDAHNNPNPTKRHRVTVVSRPVVVCNKSRKSSVISITPSYGFFLSLTNNEICFLFPSSRDAFSDNRNHPLCFFPFSPIILLVSRRITTRKLVCVLFLHLWKWLATLCALGKWMARHCFGSFHFISKLG
jgi:hypothetical protein